MGAVADDAGCVASCHSSREENKVARTERAAGSRFGSLRLGPTEAIDREDLEANLRLLGVANCAVGFANVAPASRLGLPVTNTPGLLTDTTTDLTCPLLLAAGRHVALGHRYVAEWRFRLWSAQPPPERGREPRRVREAKTLGILGYGRIGPSVHRRATGFEMRSTRFDPFGRARIEAAATCSASASSGS